MPSTEASSFLSEFHARLGLLLITVISALCVVELVRIGIDVLLSALP